MAIYHVSSGWLLEDHVFPGNNGPRAGEPWISVDTMCPLRPDGFADQLKMPELQGGESVAIIRECGRREYLKPLRKALAKRFKCVRVIEPSVHKSLRG